MLKGKIIFSLLLSTTLCFGMNDNFLQGERNNNNANHQINKEDFDKQYIEDILLPQIRLISSHSAYDTYESFIKNKGTGYAFGMDLNDYWNLFWAKDAVNNAVKAPKPYELPAYLATKETFDRQYIEDILLPQIRLISSHSAYDTYESFINNKGTGYAFGMDLNDYWNEFWAKDAVTNAVKAPKPYELPAYLLENANAYEHFINQFVERFRALNPRMPADLAEAWVNHARNPQDLAHMIKASGYSHNTQLHAHENPGRHLYFYPVPPDGSCGYWALGISRKQALESLMNMLNGPENQEKQEYIDMIANTIPGALPDHMKTDEYSTLSQVKEALDDEITQDIQELNNQLGLEDDQRMGAEDLFVSGMLSAEQAVNLLEICHQRAEITENLSNWYHREDVIKDFVNHEINNLWLGFLPGRQSLLDVIADLNNINLLIYQADPENKNQLDILHQHHTGRANAQVRHLLFSGGHYDRLVDQPLRVDVPNMNFVEEEATDAEVLLAGEVMKRLIEQLQPQRKQLENQILDFEREEDAYVEGYQQELGLNQANAKRRYDEELAQMKVRLREFEAQVQQVLTGNILAAELRKEPAIKLTHIASILDQMGFDDIIVIKPNQKPKLAPDNLDQLIDELKGDYEWIEVQEDGIYASVDKAVLPERVYEFENTPPAQKYAQNFYDGMFDRDPEDKDRQVLNNLLAKIQQYLPADSDAARGVQYILRLMDIRDRLIQENRFYLFSEGNLLVHLEYCDPAARPNWGGRYDGMNIRQRLNRIHNLPLRAFELAELRGKTEDFIRNGLDYYFVCMDGYSERIIGYVDKNLIDEDIYKEKSFSDPTCKNNLCHAAVQFAQNEAGEVNRQMFRNKLRADLMEKQFKDRVFGENEIRELEEYVEDVLYLDFI